MKLKSAFTWLTIVVLLVFSSLLSACRPAPAIGDKPLVVASTSIIGDVVAQLAGENIELFILLPVDSDPHSYQPSPKDLAILSKADLFFINGLGLEEFLNSSINPEDLSATIVPLSENLTGLLSNTNSDAHIPLQESDHYDPHVWLNPLNLLAWVDIITENLSSLDPQHLDSYESNAQIYRDELLNLDLWIQTQVNQLKPDQRLLVTDHAAWAYFADAYGFELVGTLLPGYSTLAEPSPRDLAILHDLIAEKNIQAIFISQAANPNLASQLAEDLQIKLLPVYTGTLSGPEGPAATYLLMMRYNVDLFVNNLR